MYHEATVFNLLNLSFEHQNANKEAKDSIMDLLTILIDKFHHLVHWEHPRAEISLDSLMNTSEEERFNQSIEEMNFSVSINSLGLFRSISEHLDDLPLCALDFILVVKDLITTFVMIIEHSPWMRNHKCLERFDQGRWIKIDNDDFNVLSKIEAQVWLALMNLLLEHCCKRKYVYTKRNQETVLRVLFVNLVEGIHFRGVG
jgi:hypothetical protein